jgi:pimeloyl-ACP methyl ester carboxylesterase
VLDADWLLRLYGFTWRLARGEVPALEERIDRLAEQLVQRAQDGGVRELLVVGHSTGSQVAAMVMARALRLAPWLGTRGPQVALLTLGHCTPVLAWVREAGWFRDDLARLADHPSLTWHDIAAPADWAAFVRVAPWLVSGRARLARYSPRFHATLDAAHYQRLRSHRHEMHQQYLRAPQRPGGYDPLLWMAGPLTLAERHLAGAQTGDPALR